MIERAVGWLLVLGWLSAGASVLTGVAADNWALVAQAIATAGWCTTASLYRRRCLRLS